MPCISGRFDPTKGIIIPISIHAANTLCDPASLIQGVEFKALLDTGATKTAISPKVVQAIGLHPIGQIEVHSVAAARPTNTYIIDMQIKFGNMVLTITGNLVTEFIGANNFDVLLGMDVILRGSLNVSHDGHFTFCL